MVDVAAARPYVGGVNLLLLLSALLSALTGAQGTRAAPTPVAVAQVAQQAVAAQTKQIASGDRPVAALPALAAMVGSGPHRAWALAPTAPLFLSRRRE